MADLKWYEVLVNSEVGYRIMVQAEGEMQAEHIIGQLIDYGELPEPESCRDIVHRDTIICDVQSAKEYEPPAKKYNETERILARLAFLLQEQVNGEYHLCHDPRALPDLSLALQLTMTALEYSGIDTRGDEISIINEGR